MLPRLSLTSLATSIAADLPNIESFGANAALVHYFVADVIEATEKAYSAAGSGAHKKAAVMGAARAFVAAIDRDWPTIAPHIDSFIETTIGAYNLAATWLPGLPAVPTGTATGFVNAVENEVKAVAAVAAPLVTAFENTFGGAKPAPVVTQPVSVPAAAAQPLPAAAAPLAGGL
ncbi:gp26 [Burkholderia phage Bcep781]|uniref:Gp26 n=1 Tax=Burkholderia phage Bcep781 TaxID=2883946 RepID=Q8HAN3_9CAUD|nr:gp26 [Burkholderia phage Bcep781]AAN38027.1 gp26 [Burkholderia phage Bcep781]